MLTVKHVMNGSEAIHSAPYGVRYDGPFAPAGSPDGPMVTILSEGGIDFGLAGGTVYVMNDHGATVGIYKLGPTSAHLSDRSSVGSMPGTYSTNDVDA